MSSPMDKHARRNPYLFVVGCPRSGTTLLQRMLDNHPELAVANDTHFIPRALGHDEADPDLPLTADLLARVRAYRRFPRLGLTDAEVDEAAARTDTYAAFVGYLYHLFARKHGKPLGGEKTPDYVRHLPLLHRLFPRARFVHIIRDGRDVALSTLGWAHENKGPGKWTLWQDEPVGTCALWWRWQVSAGRNAGALLSPDRYYALAYEDLVAQPEAELEKLALFLKLPCSPRMAAFHEGKTRPAPGRSAKSAWLPPTQGLRDWRTQMAPHEVALFEALAGDLLKALGYERRYHAIPPDVWAVAAQCRKWWADQGGKPGRRPRANHVATS